MRNLRRSFQEFVFFRRQIRYLWVVDVRRLLEEAIVPDLCPPFSTEIITVVIELIL